VAPEERTVHSSIKPAFTKVAFLFSGLLLCTTPALPDVLTLNFTASGSTIQMEDIGSTPAAIGLNLNLGSITSSGGVGTLGSGNNLTVPGLSNLVFEFNGGNAGQIALVGTLNGTANTTLLVYNVPYTEPGYATTFSVATISAGTSLVSINPTLASDLGVNGSSTISQSGTDSLTLGSTISTTGGGYGVSGGITNFNVSSLTYAIAITNAPTPEPASFALLGGGLICLGFIARRRKLAR
jgi:hypothetical protein